MSLHLGLEKTGTTSFQRLLMDNIPDYIGKTNSRRIASDLPLGYIRRIFLSKPPNWWGTQESQALINHINDSLNNGMLENPVVSFENFLAHNLFISRAVWSHSLGNESWTSVDHLQKLFEVTAFSRFELNILLTVRRQPEWLGSLYAQRSNRILNPNQRDFEEKIEELLSSPTLTAPVNLYSLANEINEKLKPFSFRFVALETFGQDAGLNQLVEWLPDNYRESLPKQIPSLYSRSTKDAAWRLRTTKFNSVNLIKEVITNLQKRFPAIEEVDFLYPSIQMNENLSHEILEAVSLTNKKAERFAPAGLPNYF